MNAHKKQRKSTTTDETVFRHRYYDLHSTTVYVVQPPPSLSSDHPPWITTNTTFPTHLHPLTLKPLRYNLPTYLDLFKLHRTAIAVSHNLGFHVDKLLVFPPDAPFLKATILVLYNGGHFKGCPRFSKVERWIPWIDVPQKGRDYDKFDDVVVFNDKVYAIDRIGVLKLVNTPRTTRRISLGKDKLCTLPTFCSRHGFVWRRRFVVVGGKLYLVARKEENLFRVYKLTMMNEKVFRWDEVREFEGNNVLFMAKDYYFFMPASSKFPGREYKNCIVFSEAAFPVYGKDCWEFQSEDDIAVFRLADGTFGREGGSSVFPKINWSPPPWIFDVSFKDNIYHAPVRDFEPFSRLESQSESERESVKDEDSDNGGKEDAKVHSDLKDPNREDEVEQEGIESEKDSRDQEQEVMEVDSNSQHQEAVIIRCDSDSQEKEDDETSLQEDLSPFTDSVKAAISAAEEEVTITLLNMSDWNGATEKVAETSRKRKNNIESELKASTSTTKSHSKRDPQTTKFEGFDIKSDLVPTLRKIWQKYGNLIENSTMRSSEMIARALESLATMVQILEDNSAQSLSDGQVDYLVSTLSDLKCICFNVCWLSSCVDKAVQLHKSKSLVDSLKNLNQLSSEVKERRAVLLAKLDEAEQKLKEKMEKVSKLIPFNGQFRLEEPLGMGLT